MTESGNKNMTLNNFVFAKKSQKEKEKNTNSYINESSINNINLHKNQIRKSIDDIEGKNDDINNNDIDADTEEIKTNAYDDISNPFIKEKQELDIEEDNEPTKIKNKKTSKKNQGKVAFKTILDFFNK